MIICPNCGAEIDEDVTKCPYCEYINIRGAKKKYYEEIEEIKTENEKKKKEPVKALRKGFFSGIKTVSKVTIALVIVVIIFAAIIIFELRNSPRMFRSAEQEANASVHKAIAAEQIAEAYENKDIEKLAEIFDKAYSEERVSLWGVPHYDSAQAASNYVKLRQCISNLDKEKIPKKEAEEITYYCFWFYYKGYGDDGAVLFDAIRDHEILPIMQERLGFTIEEMEGLKGKVTDSGIVNRTALYRETKKYFKDYH